MRILVTGGAGFIGSNLVRKLVQLGIEVFNVDALTYAGNLQSLVDVSRESNYRFARVDIADASAIGQAIDDFRPTAIMHLAAESHVDRSIDGPWQFIRSNVVGTFHLIQAALRYWRGLQPAEQRAFRFLHVSTDEVFGSLDDDGFFQETTAYDPHSPYSASKAASDHLARAWHKTYGLPVLVTNCSNNYGPYQFPEKLIPMVLLKCLHGESIPVYGTGENVRDWLFVEDHCEALMTVLRKGRVGQTYNIGGNNLWRNIDLVRLLCDLVDELSPRPEGEAPRSSYITFVADRPGHDWRYAIDARKIMTDLGWSPQQDHVSGFRKTVQWYLEHRNWWQNILSGVYQLQRLGVDSQ